MKWRRSVCRRISYKLSATFIGFRGETMESPVALKIYSDSDKVRRFIAEYADIDPKEVTDEAVLTDDLGLDWLDQLELMVLIEDEFVGVDFIANTTAEQINVVGDLIRHIEHHSDALARRSAA